MDSSFSEEDKKTIGGMLESMVEGFIVNVNTIEDFKNVDHVEKAQGAAISFKSLIESGIWRKNPSCVN